MTYADPSLHASDNTAAHLGSVRGPLVSRGVGFFSAALLSLALLAALAAPRAGAVSDSEELTRIGSQGSGAGQLSVPRSIATDPLTGHVFTAENGNVRISEFTPWGNFVKAFGWDVAPGAVNEQQEVRVKAAAGQFKLTFGASTTPDLAFNAPGSQSEGPGSVEAALNALPSIGGAGGSVSVEAVAPGFADGITPYIYVIAFKGSLAATNVAELTASNGTTPLSGGNPSSSVEARTRADGTAGGVGLESCTEESGCKAGLSGSDPGQFSHVTSVAVDSAGNVYVADFINQRLQKFDSAGRFVLTFGGGPLSGGIDGLSIAFCPNGLLCPAGSLFVSDGERILRFSLAGAIEAELPFPGEVVRGVAFDPVSEDLYAIFQDKTGVHKLDPTSGAGISQLEGRGALATDPFGNVYAQGAGGGNSGKVVQYDSAGKPLSPPSCCESPTLPNDPNTHFTIFGLGTNTVGDLYVSYFSPNVDSFIRLFGPGPVSLEAPPKVPPSIGDQFATSVQRDGATLGAEINPHFWTDARFYVEYGTGKCSEGGCETLKPLPPGSFLSTKPVDGAVKSPAILLEGLKPGTTYHYRFVVESSGGGPVRGIGGEVGVDGEESSFTTYPTQTPFKADCPNQGFRTGFSAPLPDCRAFEMVSPIDKNNGDIKSLANVAGYSAAMHQSSADGDKFTYSSFRAFADPKAGTYINQYVASRKDGIGWENKAISPPQGHGAAASVGSSLDSAYRIFSADLCNGWLLLAAEPVLVPGVPEGYRQPYRRDNCGSGGYESLIGVQPAVNDIELQGTSADGEKTILRVNAKLTEDAADGPWQTYYANNGELRLICVLPSGSASGGNCAGGMGSGNNTELNRFSSVTNAISDDGNRVYWTDSGGNASGPGKVYLRLNPSEEQSAVSGGECSEAEKACTLKVSETESSKAAEFLGASLDGQRALFEVVEGVQEGNLYLFDLASPGGATLIAKKAVGSPGEGFRSGLLGASEDLSHVYFVSEEVLPETSGATAGEPNLYLDQEGTKTFIATLSGEDVRQTGIFSNTSSRPIFHVARVSPDGTRLAFISTESLTGYDNTDQATGEADAEVYLYEVGEAGPVCISCNPSGARPLGRVLRFQSNSVGLLPAAATLPSAQFTLHFPSSLSADGKRVFFNSFDALLPRDTNGKADVYQWQAAAGEKECQEQGAEIYVPGSGGCLSLISSGQSPSDSQFLDASPSGDDVFFTTNASLLSQDPGLVDIYDARAKGGLPGPPEPPGPCQGEACQIASPPPNDPTPASASFKGAGNLKPTPRCRKGKVARKGRCVAKKRKAAKRQAKRETNRNRGASR